MWCRGTALGLLCMLMCMGGLVSATDPEDVPGERVIKFLKRHGVNMNLRGGKEEDTLLIAACKEGDCEAAGLLIGAKADVCQANSVGNTPLHVCAAKGNIETAALLLKSGAKIGAKNLDGATPISVAMAAGDANMCDLLLAQGARVCKTEIDGKCSKEVIEIIQKHTSPVATLRRALVRGVHRLGGWNRLLGLACVEVVGLGIITGLTMYKRSEKPPTMDDFI